MFIVPALIVTIGTVLGVGIAISSGHVAASWLCTIAALFIAGCYQGARL